MYGRFQELSAPVVAVKPASYLCRRSLAIGLRSTEAPYRAAETTVKLQIAGCN